uniref:Transporter associated with antigen processing, subunit type a n=1 Tax=Acanthochromis polyacanthus TaxID=80966 RepID=A0A3Q1FL28_9TELE
MAVKTATMHKVAAFILGLCVDLSLFYASGFAVTHSVFGNLARLWVSAALRWLALSAVSLLTLGELKPLLTRFITAHSLLPAVFETGSKALYTEESQCGQVADARCWMMAAGASLAAALFWEITAPDSDEAATGKEKKQKARVLFMRVLYMLKPHYLLLLGGLVFLSLAVICKEGGTNSVLGDAAIQTPDSSSKDRKKLQWSQEYLESDKSNNKLKFNENQKLLSLAMQDSMALANEAANEVVSGIRVVQSFNTKTHEACRYDNRLMDIHKLKTRRDTVRAIYLLVRRLTGLGMQVIMLYYGKLFIQRGQMTTGNLVSFILYQSDLGDNIRTLTYVFGDMLNSVGAAGKVFEYLDRKPQVSTDGERKPDQLTGHYRTYTVSFKPPLSVICHLLQDFTLELKPGQMTALVGSSGEGKSTCVSLLERFYEPQDGEILLDGIPLESYDHSFLHKKIAVVSQEPVLFSGSIKDNIAYGLPDCSLDEIQEAARKANAHDFIRQLDKGYDTGKLFTPPQIDIKSSQALAKCPNQTLLVIAHRLKTIEKADQIVVISGGKVGEQGTHQELMDMKGSYYKLRMEHFTEENSPQ